MCFARLCDRQVKVEYKEHSFRSKVVSSLDPEFCNVFEFLVDREQAADADAAVRCEVRDIRGVDDIKVKGGPIACAYCALSAGKMVDAYFRGNMTPVVVPSTLLFAPPDHECNFA